MDAAERQKTFDQWLREHKALTFKVICAYARNPQDKEDLFQEIALQLWKSIPNFRGDSAVTTWIYRVSLNTALAWCGKEKRRNDKNRTFAQNEEFLVQNPNASNPRLTWLYDQIAALSEVDRSLALLLLDGYSYKEMAGIIGISETNVGVRINRIKKRLIKESETETAQ
ncbi:MAG: RNA polymerase sigma factor [Verrucomicrobiota bacterium]